MSHNNSSKRETIAAVILTYNNEKIIGRLLKSIAWMDEIIIVDSGSTDSTQELIRKICPKAKIFYRKLESFAKQRNFGLNQATSDWVIHLDSDFELDKELCDSIRIQILESHTKNNGFRFMLRDYFHDIPMHYELPTYPIHRRTMGHFEGIIDENLVIEGEIGWLKGRGNHYGIPSISHFVKKINHYSDKKARRYDPEQKTKYSIIVKAIINPIRLFIHVYVLHKTYKDGFSGFILAAVRALNQFLTYAKIWESRYCFQQKVDTLLDKQLGEKRNCSNSKEESGVIVSDAEM